MSDHTPTPWQFYWRVNEDGEADCGIFSEVRKGHAYSVARCPRYQKQGQWETDAAFIVRAVNAHDDLVAALEPFVSNHPITQFDFIAYREAAKNALAKAKKS